MRKRMLLVVVAVLAQFIGCGPAPCTCEPCDAGECEPAVDAGH